MEQCLSRLDAVLFNALLMPALNPESSPLAAVQAPDTICDPKAYPFPYSGRLTFQNGLEIKYFVSCSRACYGLRKLALELAEDIVSCS